MTRRTRWFAMLAVPIGIAECWFATQLRTWHGRGSWVGVPTRKVLIWTWPASELWIDPVLLAFGLTTVVVALVLFVAAARTDRRISSRVGRGARPTGR